MRAEKARGAWDAAAAAATTAMVAAGSSHREEEGVGWHAVVDHGPSAPLFSTAPRPLPTPVAASALTNMTQQRFCEDIITRRVRRGMLARGVESDLLVEGSELRVAALAGSGGGGGAITSSLQSAFLTSLAPALPALTGSSPLLPSGVRHSGSEAAGGGSATARGLAAAAAAAPPPFALSAALSSTGAMRVTHPALTASLALAAEASAVTSDSHNHSLLHARALDAMGVRLTSRQPPERAHKVAGLSRDGERDMRASTQARVAAALGREAVAGGAATGGGGGGGGGSPVRLPSVDATTGVLGEWDKFRLMNIFKAADRDGSGELSIDEIRACISDCADYGFCVTLEEGADPEPSQRGRPGEEERPLSRAATPLGLAASTALLGTTSAAGRAAVLGAAKRLNALLEAIFVAVDTNKSGTISWSEFSQALDDGAARAGGPLPPQQGGGGGAASTLGGSSSSSNDPALHVPRMRFRPLTDEECSARANRHFRVAQEKYKALQVVQHTPPPTSNQGGGGGGSGGGAPPSAATISAHAAWVKESSARLSLEAAAASEKAVRLAALAKALGGRYDPPERPRPPPPRRSDQLQILRVVPVAEDAKTRARGGAGYKLPLPGEEVGHDDLATLAVLHPTVLQEEEEAEDELAGGSKRAQRASSASAVTRTLGKEQWERHRTTQKARAPHVVHSSTLHM